MNSMPSRTFLILLRIFAWLFILSPSLCQALFVPASKRRQQQQQQQQQQEQYVKASFKLLPSITSTTTNTAMSLSILGLSAKKDDDDEIITTSNNSKSKNNNNNNNNKSSRDFYEREEESSKRVIRNLTAGSNLGNLITTAGVAFLAFGFALNLFGLDYVVKNGQLTIGTVEERQFQMEMNRVSKPPKNTPPLQSSLQSSFVKRES